MVKRELRRIYTDKRKLLTPQDMNRMDDLMLIHFQQYPTGDAEVLLSYQPIPQKQEVNTHLMVDYLFFRIPSLQVAYPVIDILANTFRAIRVDDQTEYQLNHYGITEPLQGSEIDPLELDAVFIPLLAFDTNGYRVGYGKGFYDRFLARCRPDILKIGFSYFDPVAPISDINDYDVPLSICITPNQLYEF